MLQRIALKNEYKCARQRITCYIYTHENAQIALKYKCAQTPRNHMQYISIRLHRVLLPNVIMLFSSEYTTHNSAKMRTTSDNNTNGHKQNSKELYAIYRY